MTERCVVVGVDCTPASTALLQWADRQAQLVAARLVAVTAWRIDLPGLDLVSTVVEVEARTRQVLTETIRQALPPHRASAVTLRVLDTAPSDALVAESTEADLLVVGPHSTPAIHGLLLGSVTEHVVSQACCPVAVVHIAEPTASHRMVVGLDGSDCSRRALDWAIDQAALTASCSTTN